MSDEQAMMLRHEVPVDGEWHPVRVIGDVVHVASRHADTVEFWTRGFGRGAPGVERWYQVFGTGQPLPVSARYVGTALAAGGALVWHLFEDASR